MTSITVFQALTLAIAMLLFTTSGASRPALTKLGNGEGGGQTECWTVVSNMRPCTKEIIVFLLNGQADIGKPCCVAIATIVDFCLPALFLNFGYTPEAVSTLQNYCEKTGSTVKIVATNTSP